MCAQSRRGAETIAIVFRMTGFGIYVHWPFCAAKCPYCDFNSHVRARIDEDAWTDAIMRELEHVAAWQGDAKPIVETIFFGGGTPSLMSGKAVGTARIVLGEAGGVGQILQKGDVVGRLGVQRIEGQNRHFRIGKSARLFGDQGRMADDSFFKC